MNTPLPPLFPPLYFLSLGARAGGPASSIQPTSVETAPAPFRLGASTPNVCPQEGKEQRDAARSLANGSTAAIVIGGVAIL